MNKERLEQAEREIEISIDVAREFVDRKNMILELAKNKNFKAIIEEGYFKDNAARLVMLLADPEYVSEEKKQNLYDDMMGIAGLRGYLATQIQLGNQMERKIASSESALDEFRLEAGEK